MEYSDLLHVNATLVANEFLDKYMPKANGEYVKVYLYLLKNQVNGIDIGTIAENLSLTEGDVRRAIKYWEEQGILTRGKEREALRKTYRKAEGADVLLRLSKDGEFAQLLFVVQKYMSKILTDTDQQVFAYLYDGLNMPCDVLEYLVEYCVQTGHNNIRYIETVGLDWVDSGIRDVESAKKRTKSFDSRAEETARKKQEKRSKLGVRSGTDYDALILEQVVKKMEQ